MTKTSKIFRKIDSFTDDRPTNRAPVPAQSGALQGPRMDTLEGVPLGTRYGLGRIDMLALGCLDTFLPILDFPEFLTHPLPSLTFLKF